MEMYQTYPEISTYLVFPIIETEADFIKEIYHIVKAAPGECLYSVFKKIPASGEEKPDRRWAGVVSLSATDPVNAMTEIGICISPEFQRTHVATNAIGLMLQYMLDPPSAGGLGLRRVEWRCHVGNEASRRIALRMGFEFEGVLRWNRVLPRSTTGLPVEALERRNGTTGEVLGRHTAVFSIVWDEWDEKRPNVVSQMERKQ